jgi:prepilin-type processing-associated H-X9-DG protein
MRRLGFTIFELLVVIVILLLLMTIFIPALRTATSGTQHIRCMTNMRELSVAWISFAINNHNQLPNGEAGFWRTNAEGVKETPWVGRCWAKRFKTDQLPAERQVEEIKRGTLFPYANDLRIYRCPTGREGEMLTYACLDSMYGRTRNRGDVFQPGVYIRKLFEIPRASQRALYIDEGHVTPDSYAVYFHREEWWDDVAVRHGSGTTMAFADGHSERWIFEGDDTVEHGLDYMYGWYGQWTPTTKAGFYDLYRMQIATWGRLDYTPSYPLGVFNLEPTVDDPQP